MEWRAQHHLALEDGPRLGAAGRVPPHPRQLDPILGQLDPVSGHFKTSIIDSVEELSVQRRAGAQQDQRGLVVTIL